LGSLDGKNVTPERWVKMVFFTSPHFRTTPKQKRENPNSSESRKKSSTTFHAILQTIQRENLSRKTTGTREEKSFQSKWEDGRLSGKF
jgi:hypothetical protein